MGWWVRVVTGRRSKWAVLALWLGLSVFGGLFGPKLITVQTNDQATFLPRSAESTEVLELRKQFTGDDVIPAVVVYVRDGQPVTPADLAAVQAQADAFAELAGVEGQPSPPIPSRDGLAIEVVVPLHNEVGGLVADTVEQMRAITATSPDGLTGYVGGPGGLSGDFQAAFSNLNAALLVGAVLVVILVLLVTYRSPTLWLWPLIAVFIADLVAQAVNYFLVQGGLIAVNGQTQSILLVLVFGAGTDYALLIIARYREELRLVEDTHEAMARALRRAGPAVVASAGTVAISLLCLLFAQMQSTRGLGPVCAVGIIVALFAMTSLLPATLLVVGRGTFWPAVPAYGSPTREGEGAFAGLAAGIARHPRPLWLGTVAVLALIALNAVNLGAGDLTREGQFTTETESMVAQDLLGEHFARGVGSPVVVIGPAESAEAAVEVTAADPAVAEVGRVAVIDGLAQFEATLSVAPESQEAYDAVERLRADLDVVSEDMLVGGTTAIEKDIRDTNRRDLLVVVPLVLAVLLVILALLLRALVAPVMLIATVVLSYFTTLGLCAFLFNEVLGYEGADTAFPMFAFIFLVALGIDYNIFLMSRVREEAQVLGTRPGIVRGLAVTGGVITSAGIVLAATFLVLTRLPLVAIAQVGIAVAVGVLLDALVVRSVLVPAIAYDLGGRVWWPRRLPADLAGPAEESEPAVVGS